MRQRRSSLDSASVSSVSSTVLLNVPSVLYPSLRRLNKIAIERDNSNWILLEINEGVRISKQLNKSSSSNIVLRFTTLIDASPSSVLNVLLNTSLQPQWDPRATQSVSLKRDTEGTSDLIFLGAKPYSFWAWPRYFILKRYVHQLDVNTYCIPVHSVQHPLPSVLQRTTYSIPNFWHGSVLGDFNGYGWIITATSIGQSIVSLICKDVNWGGYLDSARMSLLLSYQFAQTVAGLREHFALIPRKVIRQYREEREEREQHEEIEEREETFDDFSLRNEENLPRSESVGDELVHQEERVSGNEEEVFLERSESKDEGSGNSSEEEIPLSPRPDSGLEKLGEFGTPLANARTMLFQLANGNMNDGWKYHDTIDDVEIFKQDIKGCVCIKGTSVIPFPMHAFVDLIRQHERRAEYDEMFDRAEVIEKFSNNMLILHMLYKGVWPTTARDFVNLAFIQIVDANNAMIVATSVDHPNCPPQKGYVRAHLYVAGYVLKQESINPPSLRVTYVSHVDLMGNIPGLLVNQVTVKQPLIIANVRKILASEDLSAYVTRKSPPLKLKTLRTNSFNNSNLPDKNAKDNASNPSSDTSNRSNKSNNENPGERKDENLKNEAKDIKDNVSHTSSSSRESISSSTTKDNLSQSQISSASSSVQDVSQQVTTTAVLSVPTTVETNSSQPRFSLNLPLDSDKGSSPPPSPPSGGPAKIPQLYKDIITYSIHGLVDAGTGSRNAGWSYTGTQRGVVLLQKATGTVHCFRGTGQIKFSPQRIKNLVERFDDGRAKKWDKMLKDVKLVEEIDVNTRVYHMQYETVKCSPEMRRDFCVIFHWNTLKDGTLIGCAKSIMHPQCPPVEGWTRGNILASGFIIKATESNPSSSLVVYVSQIDMDGLSSSVVSLAGSKQPLIVAEIREILEAMYK